MNAFLQNSLTLLKLEVVISGEVLYFTNINTIFEYSVYINKIKDFFC